MTLVQGRESWRCRTLEPRKAQFTIWVEQSARDWEDIAIGPDPSV